jgi:hypothetical protein
MCRKLPRFDHRRDRIAERHDLHGCCETFSTLRRVNGSERLVVVCGAAVKTARRSAGRSEVDEDVDKDGRAGRYARRLRKGGKQVFYRKLSSLRDDMEDL